MRKILTLACSLALVCALLPASPARAQVAKTHVVDHIRDASGSPLSGKVTFILTQKAATGGDGLVVASPTVSATLDSSGLFSAYLYPSSSLSPASYYQVYVTSGAGNQTYVGLYNIPASSSVVTLSPNKVTDANLAAQYTFAPQAAIVALTQTISQAALATMTFANVVSALGYTPANAASLGTMASQNANNVNVTGGTLNGITCVGCTNVGTGSAGGVANAGDTTIAADTDASGAGRIVLQTGGVTRATIEADGSMTGLTPAQVRYASQAGAALNSDILAGGGSDDTAQVQAQLTAANTSGKPTLVVIDGAARVGPLTIYPNTTLRCINGGGLYLRNGGNNTLLRNAHPSATAATDHDIAIENCTFNGNRAGQTGTGLFSTQTANGTLIGAVQMYGVRNLRIEGCNVINSKSIGIHAGALTNAYLSGNYVEGDLSAQQNGIQIEGNSQHVQIVGTRGKNLDDDFIALSSDGASWVNAPFTGLGPYVGAGPISDVTVRDSSCDYCMSAFRLFNSANRIDRVTVDGITGRYFEALFLNEPGGLTGGNVGTVSISNANVHMINNTSLASLQTGVALYLSFDHLILKNINFNDPEDPRGHLYVDASADVKHLEADGFNVYDTDAAAAAPGSVMMYVAGRVRQFDARNVLWSRGASLGRVPTLLHVVAGGRVDDLLIDGLKANRVDNVFWHDTSTTTNTATLRNVRHLDATDATKATVSNTAGTISVLDVSGWYSDVAKLLFNSATITAKRGDAFVARGSCTLVAGQCAVAHADTASATVVSDITRTADGGTVGASYSVVKTNGVGFTITAMNGSGAAQTADTSTLTFQIKD